MMSCFRNLVCLLTFFFSFHLLLRLFLSLLGEEFHYTTHGFTVLSAVIESVVNEPFDKYMVKFFKKLGLKNTYLDENEPVIKQRSRL